jgi:hypothetical protein
MVRMRGARLVRVPRMAVALVRAPGMAVAFVHAPARMMIWEALVQPHRLRALRRSSSRRRRRINRRANSRERHICSPGLDRRRAIHNPYPINAHLNSERVHAYLAVVLSNASVVVVAEGMTTGISDIPCDAWSAEALVHRVNGQGASPI